MFDSWRGFSAPALSKDWRERLTEMGRIARGHILKMTTVAASGHPGGSMSSLEIYLMLYNMARVDPGNPRRDDRDRIVISHGHTSPGVYAALAAAGFFDILPVLHGFRQAGSPYEGHVEQSVPGVEWDTGNLGQGLSVGIGKAIYARLSGQSFYTFVVMGDGEQQKGQIAEARRQASKFGLFDITVLIDYNQLQISGRINDILPQNIRAEWEAADWKVIEVDGHNLDELYDALHVAVTDKSALYMILAHTVMGKGVSFMENDEGFHGAAVSRGRIGAALAELGVEDDIEQLLKLREQGPPPLLPVPETKYPALSKGEPIIYTPADKKDNRSAWGAALVSVADANNGKPGINMAVFDCDLAKSVKTHLFAEEYPDHFFELGITEHSTAVVAGSLSAERAVSIWSDFGVFGIAETYNQARLNDINNSNLKLFCTHSGVNVGEDGKTHQCIDYFGLLNSTFGWKVITPADPNQTDRIVRYVLSHPGNFAVIMGRSVMPVITDENGGPFFGKDYTYRYGRMETIRSGQAVALVAAGNMLNVAFEAWEKLAASGNRIALVSVSDWSDLHEDDLRMLGDYEQVVVLEDHNIRTGLGTAVGAALQERGMAVRLTKLGVTRYASSGKTSDLYKLLGLDAESVLDRILHLLGNEKVGV